MPSPVFEVIDQLPSVMERGDVPGFTRLVEQLFNKARRLSPDQLTAAIGELAPILATRPEGVFARLALIAGALVEWGGSPLALAENSTACALATMRLRLAFSDAWQQEVGGGDPEPGPDRPPAMRELVDRFRATAVGLNVPERVGTVMALSFFDVGHWVNLMITLMGSREFRTVAPLLAELGQAAHELGDKVPRAHWLIGLSQVLDDEPVVVIDHATGRGYRLTMSGIGDNYQLHTLLADRLIGDPARGMLAGEPPRPAWVAATTTAHPACPAHDPIRRRFRLFDATGAYISPEGRPADIARVEGARVILLHPPRGNFGWLNGRTYEHMIPSLTLDAIMTGDEVQRWRARVAPARETDLFGTLNRPGP